MNTNAGNIFEISKTHPKTMVNRHYHRSFEIYMLTEGSGRYFIENSVYTIRENDIIFIPKNVIHNTSYGSGNAARILINFCGEYIAPPVMQASRGLFSSHIYRPKPQNVESLRRYFDDIEREYNSKDEFSSEIIKCLMTEMFVFLLRNAPCEETNASESINEKIILAINIINREYTSDITLSDIAGRMDLNESYFSRLFKENTGFGFKEYVNMLRLKKARSLLINTKKTVIEIAFECGFNDSNYFSLVFSKSFGISPIKFRRTYN